MKKEILAILLFLLMVGELSGCGNQTTNSTSEQSVTGTEAKLESEEIPEISEKVEIEIPEAAEADGEDAEISESTNNSTEVLLSNDTDENYRGEDLIGSWISRPYKRFNMVIKKNDDANLYDIIIKVWLYDERLFEFWEYTAQYDVENDYLICEDGSHKYGKSFYEIVNEVYENSGNAIIYINRYYDDGGREYIFLDWDNKFDDLKNHIDFYNDSIQFEVGEYVSFDDLEPMFEYDGRGNGGFDPEVDLPPSNINTGNETASTGRITRDQLFTQNGTGVTHVMNKFVSDYNRGKPNQSQIRQVSMTPYFLSPEVTYSGYTATLKTKFGYWYFGHGGDADGYKYAIVVIDLETGNILSESLSDN